MKRKINSNSVILLVCLFFLILFLMTGCGSMAERRHPNYETYKKAIGTLLLLPPQFQVMEEMADHSLIDRLDLGLKAGRLAMEAVAAEMTLKLYTTRTPALEEANSDEIRQVTDLYTAVNKSIQLHTYGSQPFPHKIQYFEYSVGNVESLLAKYDADTLVLITGKETVSQLSPRAWLSVAVVEPKGQIVWYCVQSTNEILQLGDIKDMTVLVKKILQNFPSNTQ